MKYIKADIAILENPNGLSRQSIIETLIGYELELDCVNDKGEEFSLKFYINVEVD